MKNQISVYIAIGVVLLAILTNIMVISKLDRIQVLPQVAGSTQSATGTTFNSSKRAGITFTPATGTATSTSILNTDSTDRIIVATDYYCGGVGTSLSPYVGGSLNAFVLYSATTSAANATATTSSSNLIAYNIISTSTPDSYMSSSTVATNSAQGRIWASGSYLTFWTNATNTAVCNVSVPYIAL